MPESSFNRVPIAKSKDGSAEASILLADTHVHIYGVFDVDTMFDAAASNLAAAAVRMGLGGMPRQLMLLLTETARDDAFAKLKSGELRPSRWRMEATVEPAVLRAVRDGGTAIWLVAGRQIATREDLEVLALGTTEKFPDGKPIGESIEASDRLAAMTALPWGFGKWWGSRGRRIGELMRTARSKPLFLGDNGGRLALSRRPALLGEGERLGHRVLPGTDPLPFPGQEKKVGSFGIVLTDWDAGDRPLQRFVERLAQERSSPQKFGSLTGVVAFVKLQVGMQLRKRARLGASG